MKPCRTCNQTEIDKNPYRISASSREIIPKDFTENIPKKTIKLSNKYIKSICNFLLAAGKNILILLTGMVVVSLIPLSLYFLGLMFRHIYCAGHNNDFTCADGIFPTLIGGVVSAFIIIFILVVLVPVFNVGKAVYEELFSK